MRADTEKKKTFNITCCTFSFKVPVDTKLYVVELRGCGFELCPVNASVSEALAVNMVDGSSSVCHWINGSCRLEVGCKLVHVH